MVVACAAVAEALLARELFGCAASVYPTLPDAFDGALSRAEGGTLLLDEIGDLSKQMQVKLLRVLQEKQYEPLGSTETVGADVRVIASTNRNLAQDVTSRRFRQDLY